MLFNPQKMVVILLVVLAATALALGGRGLAAGQNARKIKHIVLVVDYSASAGILNAQVISHAINDTLCRQCQLGVIGFGTQVTTIVDIRQINDWNGTEFEKFDIEEMGKRSRALGSGSNYVGALGAAIDVLVNAGPQAEGRIVLLTDGSMVNTGEAGTPTDLQQKIVEQIESRLHDTSIRIYPIIIPQKSGTQIGKEEYDWWRQFAQRTGGEAIYIGSEGDIVEKLSSRFVESKDQCTLTAEPGCLSPFEVKPYQRAISISLDFKEEGQNAIAAQVIDPKGNTTKPQMDRAEQLIRYANDESPIAGAWKLQVTGNGKVGGFVLNSEQRNLALMKIGTLPSAVLAGTPVQVRFELRDQGDPDFPRPHDTSDFAAEVLLIGQSATGVYTQVVKAETADGFVFTATLPINRSDVLEGQYRVLARAESRTFGDPLQTDLGEVSWTQVPRLDGAGPAINTSEIKQYRPFTVSVQVLNTDVLVGKPQVEFTMHGPNGFGETPGNVTCERGANVTVCSAVLPGYATAGAYSIEVALAGGSTQHGLQYGGETSRPTTFNVRPMSPWEELGYDPARFLQHYWPWFVGVLALIAVAIAIYFVRRNWDFVRLKWLPPADVEKRLNLYRAIRARG